MFRYTARHHTLAQPTKLMCAWNWILIKEIYANNLETIFKQIENGIIKQPDVQPLTRSKVYNTTSWNI